MKYQFPSVEFDRLIIAYESGQKEREEKASEKCFRLSFLSS